LLRVVFRILCSNKIKLASDTVKYLRKLK